MSTFLLFGGVHCYPIGGWNDFVFAGSLEECKARFSNWEERINDLYFDWAHIVDLSTQKKVLVAELRGAGEVTWRTPTEDDR